MKAPLVRELEKARAALVRTYLLHVAWFAVMCAMVGLRWSLHGLKVSVLLTLVTVPPVLFHTVRVHRLCRRIDPTARTVGLVPVVVTTVVLSPFESGLILPAKNLFVAIRVLRTFKASQAAAPAANPAAPEAEALRDSP